MGASSSPSARYASTDDGHSIGGFTMIGLTILAALGAFALIVTIVYGALTDS